MHVTCKGPQKFNASQYSVKKQCSVTVVHRGSLFDRDCFAKERRENSGAGLC